MYWLDRIQADLTVLLIPLISAFIGWSTNVVAIWMMFYPTHFRGIPPYLGWQGIIPANAKRLGAMTTDLVMTRLLSLKELFESFKGEQFVRHLEPAIEKLTTEILDEVATKRAPQVWANAGEFMQAKVRATVKDEIRVLTIKIVDDFSAQLESFLDLGKVVEDAVDRDRGLMSRLFLHIGGKEFYFIEVSGIWLGLVFGIFQMVAWLFYDEGWVLPAAGFVVGYATNWVALKLIFEPRKPIVIGPLVLHGLFHKRQKDVAREFARMTRERVMNADNIVQSVLNGPRGDVVRGIVRGHVSALIDKYYAHPMAMMVLPQAEREPLKAELLARVEAELPLPGGLFHTFADKAVDIQDSIESRLAVLPSEEYEGVLRPAFEQDEWKLIVAGAVLGLLTGLAQLAWLFS